MLTKKVQNMEETIWLNYRIGDENEASAFLLFTVAKPESNLLFFYDFILHSTEENINGIIFN